MNTLIGKCKGVVQHWKQHKHREKDIMVAGEYGFIRALDHPITKDVFVHYSDIEFEEQSKFKQLMRGEQVEFELWKSKRGYEAKKVKLLQTRTGGDDGRHSDSPA